MAESTVHAELARLEERVAEARQADRAAQAELVNAEQAVEQAREQYDLGGDAKAATKTLRAAKEAAEQAQLAAEGVAQRVRRAIADRDGFVERNAGRLLAELAPEAERIVADMRAAAEALIAADSVWYALQSEVSKLLVAQHRRPAEDAPGSHELAETVRQLKRAPDAITSPMPHARVPAAF